MCSMYSMYSMYVRKYVLPNTPNTYKILTMLAVFDQNDYFSKKDVVFHSTNSVRLRLGALMCLNYFYTYIYKFMYIYIYICIQYPISNMEIYPKGIPSHPTPCRGKSAEETGWGHGLG